MRKRTQQSTISIVSSLITCLRPPLFFLDWSVIHSFIRSFTHSSRLCLSPSLIFTSHHLSSSLCLHPLSFVHPFVRYLYSLHSSMCAHLFPCFCLRIERVLVSLPHNSHGAMEWPSVVFISCDSCQIHELALIWSAHRNPCPSLPFMSSFLTSFLAHFVRSSFQIPFSFISLFSLSTTESQVWTRFALLYSLSPVFLLRL